MFVLFVQPSLAWSMYDFYNSANVRVVNFIEFNGGFYFGREVCSQGRCLGGLFYSTSPFPFFYSVQEYIHGFGLGAGHVVLRPEGPFC